VQAKKIVEIWVGQEALRD